MTLIPGFIIQVPGRKNGPPRYVEYVRFAGNQVEAVALTINRTEAGLFDRRRAELVEEHLMQHPPTTEEG